MKKNEKITHGEGFGEVITNQNNSIQVNESCDTLMNFEECGVFKWSRYNYFRKNCDNEFLLFNCSTNNYMYMIKDVKDIIVENMNSVEKIELINSKLYHFLIRGRFIVNEGFDEVKDAINRMKRKLNLSNSFELHINPTLDCNLKCWYCYETHQKGSVIDEYTLKSIMCFIENKVKSKELKEITISFFGGEPLLKFNQVIWPIIEFAKMKCVENNKKLYLFFNTNGVLLTKEIVNKLFSAGLICGFQVPFDGNEEYHNKTKKTINGKGTFDIIVNNIMYALSYGFRFNIRCNFTSDNIHSFDELISLFVNYAAKCIEYKILTFSYHKVWQVVQTVDMHTIVSKYEERTSLSNTTFYQCYADRENSVVINYNGDVFKCTANDFKTEDREGVLKRNGEIEYNSKYQERMEVRFSNKNCQNCRIFPICTTCTKKKLELQNRDVKCYRFASDIEKENILLKKINKVLSIE